MDSTLTGPGGSAKRLLWALAAGSIGALAACSNGSGGGLQNCPNLPIANGVIGQNGFTGNSANPEGAGSATLNSPTSGITSNGQISYVADTGNNRVLGYIGVPAGTAPAANFELGQGDGTGTDFNDTGNGVGPTSLSAPSKVFVSSDGRLVVTDTGNNRVLIWNTLPRRNSAPDIVVGQPDLQSRFANQQLAAPTAATLSHPTAAVIANNLLIVVDQGNNRVLVWNSVPAKPGVSANVELGQAATPLVSSGSSSSSSSGSSGSSSSGSSSGSGSSSSSSGGVGSGTNSTTVTCTGNSGTNGYCFTTATAAVDTLASGSTTTFLLGLNNPTDVWSDGYRLLVTDTGNNRVLYWQQIPFVNNTLYTYVLGQTQPGLSAIGASAQGLNTPWGVYSDGSSVFVADTGNNRVLAFNSFPAKNGASATGLFGQDNFKNNAANDGGQTGNPGNVASNDTFNTPTGVFTASSGELYVSDKGNHRILLFEVSSAVNGNNPTIDGVAGGCNALAAATETFTFSAPTAGAHIEQGNSQGLRFLWIKGGAPVAGSTVQFTTSGGNLVTGQGSPASSATLTTGADGTVSLSVQSASAGAVTVTATGSDPGTGKALSTSVPVIFVGAPSTITVSAQSPLPQSSSELVTVQVQDSLGSAIPGVSVGLTLPNGGGTLSQSSATTDGQGQIHVVFTPDGTVASVLVQATVDGLSPQAATISVTNSSNSNAGSLGFGNCATTVPTDSTLTCTLTLLNRSGQPISGTNVTIAAALGSIVAPTGGAFTTAANGTVSFTYQAFTSGNAAVTGAETLTASAVINSQTVSQTLKITVQPGEFTFTSPAANAQVAEGRLQPVSLTWLANGNPVAGQGVTVNLTNGTLVDGNGNPESSPQTLNTLPDGTLTFNILPTNTGSSQVTAKATDAVSSANLNATLTLNFVGLPASFTTQDQSPIGANGVSLVSATVQDNKTNPLSGVTVNFTLPSGGGTLSSNSAVTNSSGVASVLFSPDDSKALVNVQVSVPPLSPQTVTVQVNGIPGGSSSSSSGGSSGSGSSSSSGGSSSSGSGSSGGSSSGSSSSGGSSSGGSTALGGSVLANGLAVSGATVTVYAAGSAAGAPAAQIGQATTNAAGSFTANFSPLPTVGQLIYLVAKGGSAGGGVNNDIGLMTIAGVNCAGSCGFPASVTINEQSTVAATSVLQSYIKLSACSAITGNTNSGTCAAIPGATGLLARAGTFANLVEPIHGTPSALLTSNSSSAPIQLTLQKLNTLADVLAACTGSAGGTTGDGSSCGKLFVQTPRTQQGSPVFTYIADTGGNSISAFTISPSTGAMTAVPGSPFTVGGSPIAVTVDPSGRFVFVPNSASNTLSVFNIAASTGTLAAVNGSPYNTGSSPQAVAVTPNAKYVYIPNFNDGTVSGFSIDPGTGQLTSLTGSPFPAGTRPWAISVDPSGRFVYVANQGGGVSAYTVTASTGTLAAVPGSPFTAGNSPEAVAVSPGGQFVYVANFADGTVSAFAVNQSTGALNALSGSPFAVSAQPNSIAVAPNGNFVYIANGAGVSAFTVNPANGVLTSVKGSPFTAGGGPFAVTVDPSGSYVVATSSFTNNVYTYSINSSTGALSQVGSAVSTGAGPAAVAVAPTPTTDTLTASFELAANPSSNAAGNDIFALLPSSPTFTPVVTAAPANWTIGGQRFAYTANLGSNDISGFSIDHYTGGLVQLPGSPFSGNPQQSAITVDPSGRYLYVTSQGASVSGYAIDPGTGALTTMTGSPFPAGSGPQALAVPPGTQFLYAVNEGGDDVSAYTISAGTGVLTPVTSGGASACGSSADPKNCFPAGLRPTSVAADPNGGYIYVTNAGSNSISAYSFSGASGALTAINNSPFFAGAGPLALAIDPTGTYLYAANNSGNSISAYTIASATGVLGAVSGSPFNTTNGPQALAADPNGQYLYAVSAASQDLLGLNLNASTGALSAVNGSPYSANTGVNSLAVDSSGQVCLVVSPPTNSIADYLIGSTGQLTQRTSSPFAAGTSPQAIAITP